MNGWFWRVKRTFECSDLSISTDQRLIFEFPSVTEAEICGYNASVWSISKLRIQWEPQLNFETISSSRRVSHRLAKHREATRYVFVCTLPILIVVVHRCFEFVLFWQSSPKNRLSALESFSFTSGVLFVKRALLIFGPTSVDTFPLLTSANNLTVNQ